MPPFPNNVDRQKQRETKKINKKLTLTRRIKYYKRIKLSGKRIARRTKRR